MLPTKGYFQDIECPYFNSFCGRPYCHFRHRKKPSEIIEESAEIEEKSVIPTYKPTPKSQLESLQTNKSHIPISYVPDLAFRPERQIRPIPRYEKPTYNPTPLSLLYSGNTNENSTEQGANSKITVVNNEYDPLKSEIDFEDLTNEFDLIDEIINDDEIQAKFSDDNDSDSEAYKKSSSLKTSTDASINQTVKPTEISSAKHSDKESKLKTTEKQSVKESRVKVTEKHSDSDKETGGLNKKQSNKNEPKKESKSKREKVVLSSSSESEIKKDRKSINKSNKKQSEKSIESSSDSDIKKDKKGSNKLREKHSEKSSEKREKNTSSGKHSKERSSEKRDKNSDSEQSNDKHRKERSSEKRDKNSDSEHSNDKHRKHSGLEQKELGKSNKEKASKSKERDKRSESTEKRSSSTSKPKTHKSEDKLDESSHTKSHKKDKHKKEESTKDKNANKKHKNKEKDKERISEKIKEKTKPSSSEREDRKKSSKFKDSHKDKRNDTSKKHKKINDKDKRDRDKRAKTQSKKSEKVRKSSTTSHSSHSSVGNFDNFEDTLSNFDNDNNFEQEISDIDLDDEDETMRECLKIFNEYKPKPVASVPESRTLQQNTEYEDNLSDMTGRKRTAHDGAEVSQMYSKFQPPPKVKTILTPGEALRNRFRIARLAQQSREDENMMSEIEKIVHTPQQSVKRTAPPSLLEAARQLKMKKIEKAEEKQASIRASAAKISTSLVDDILNGTAQALSSGNIAPRKKIAAAPNVALIQKAKERISKIVCRPPNNIKTVAQTQKTNRQAHVPEYSLSDIPDVLQAAKSKLPVNVRTRFLTMIADECMKLYVSRDDAYARALNEEFVCYEKCKVLSTYRNSAMLAVNRLRKEIQERDVKGLGLIFAGEDVDADKSSDFEGRKFYNNVTRWVLNEEELKLHGYPREADEKGRVVINSKKEQDYSLDENYRRCSRCHKAYQVDDDGWPLYDEECMYHPLKKRTIRGEQVFLCCKSTDDSGCITSDTHVSDGLEHEQLNGYQTTLPPETDSDPRSYSVYALDCEMCYTTKGLELTRVTIVDTDCKTVYESLVKPLNPIIDYNTRFSGITAEQMNKTSTSILQVQANILHLCNAKTILVGHSLESDMKALKIVHERIIDTAVLFPHKMGLPHKRALRALASEYLKKIIQDDVNGHDSAEDAVTCMELVKWKLKDELKVRLK